MSYSYRNDGILGSGNNIFRIYFNSGRVKFFEVPPHSATDTFEKISQAVNEEYELLHKTGKGEDQLKRDLIREALVEKKLLDKERWKKVIKDISYSYYNYEVDNKDNHILRIEFDSGRTTEIEAPYSATSTFEKISQAVNEEYELLNTKEENNKNGGRNGR